MVCRSLSPYFGRGVQGIASTKWLCLVFTCLLWGIPNFLILKLLNNNHGVHILEYFTIVLHLIQIYSTISLYRGKFHIMLNNVVILWVKRVETSVLLNYPLAPPAFHSVDVEASSVPGDSLKGETLNFTNLTFDYNIVTSLSSSPSSKTALPTLIVSSIIFRICDFPY